MAGKEKTLRIMGSKWGGYALNVNLWDQNNAAILKIKHLSDLNLNEVERSGVLSDRMIGACLNYLTTSPETGHYVLTKCDLTNLNLVDITALQNYPHIQYLDLYHNELTDLSALNALSYLLYLNASRNHLTDVLMFKPPWYLTYVNLSRNRITEINNLEGFWSIIKLDLSHNEIETISGLQKLRYLRYLNLSYNLIECVQNLDNLNIQELNLEFNCIRRFMSADPGYGIETLPNLRTLIIGHNRLSSLEFFRNTYCLRIIDLKYNKIIDLMEISHLRSLVYELDLRGNPCTKWPNYKDVVLYSMPSVVFLDGVQVTVAEKVSSDTTFNPSINLVASRGLTKLILLEQLNAPKIDGSVIPFDEVTPLLIILIGPIAVKKTVLGLHIAEKFSKRIKYCRSHTTREYSANSTEKEAYHHVEREEFNEMARNGEFLTIEEQVGNNYGFHIEEIKKLRLENKIGIAQMDLQASIQMKNHYPNVKLVLVLTKDEAIHRNWIADKFKIFTWIKDSLEDIWALKIGKRQSDSQLETVENKVNFISNLIHEIINTLILPFDPAHIRSDSVDVLTNDMITQSHSMLPTTRRIRFQSIERSKRIKFKSIASIKEFQRNLSLNLDENSSELMVILDEQMNIMVDDEESKLKRRRARMLYKRKLLESNDWVSEEESKSESESELSDQSFETSPQQDKQTNDVDPKNLINMYIEIVLKSRQMYLDQHLNHPGFYSLVVYSDEFEKAVSSLKKFIRDHHVNRPLTKPHNIPEIDHLNRVIIPKKIEEIIDELRFQ